MLAFVLVCMGGAAAEEGGRSMLPRTWVWTVLRISTQDKVGTLGR